MSRRLVTLGTKRSSCIALSIAIALSCFPPSARAATPKAEHPTAAALARRVARLAGPEGAPPLALDPALASAAERHLAEVLRDPSLARRDRVESALASEGLPDAQLLPFSATGNEPGELVLALLRFVEGTVRGRGMTHVGVAWAETLEHAPAPEPHGEAAPWTATEAPRLGLAAIFSRRLVALAPLPRVVSTGRLIVRGRARLPPGGPGFGVAPAIEALALTPSSGEQPERVLELPLRPGEQGAFSVDVDVRDRPGWYTLELLANADRGPEVVALWRFRAGAAASGETPAPGAPRGQPDLGGPREAEGTPSAAAEALGGWIDALRSARDLGPLARDRRLAAAALHQARAVCETRLAAHVLHGESPVARAERAGYTGPVTENIAIAASVAAAHRNLIASPAHLRNLIDPAASAVGLAVARAPAPGRGGEPIACVVELFGTGSADHR